MVQPYQSKPWTAGCLIPLAIPVLVELLISPILIVSRTIDKPSGRILEPSKFLF